MGGNGVEEVPMAEGMEGREGALGIKVCGFGVWIRLGLVAL